MDLTSLKAWELKEKILNKEVTSREVVEAHFKKIEELDSDINAFITLNKEEALKAADDVDERISKGEKVGMLAGIPIGIKDNINTKNLRTTCGSKMLENFIPPYDAHVIEQIRKEDGIIIGKTNMDEFAMGGSTETSYFGPTKNPINYNLVPGGSSGGSAAAVAANEVALALGTDTGGSVRQPASFCGIVGIKPSYGLVSRYGVVSMANSLDAVGTFGKDTKDALLMLNAILGLDKRDSTSLDGKMIEIDGENHLEGLRIAIPKEFVDLGISNKEVEKRFNEALKVFEDAGAKIDIVSIPHLNYATETYYLISTAELSSNMARFDGIRYGHRTENYVTLDDLYKNSRTEGFGEEVKRRIMLGTYSLSFGDNEEYYKKPLKIRTLIRQDYDKVFADYDIILSLTSPTPPYEFNSKLNNPVEMYKADLYTVPINIAGLCGISIPIGMADGLPVGLQIVGDRMKEHNIIKAALGYERAVL